jgi:hypothetical protein
VPDKKIVMYGKRVVAVSAVSDRSLLEPSVSISSTLRRPIGIEGIYVVVVHADWLRLIHQATKLEVREGSKSERKYLR